MSKRVKLIVSIGVFVVIAGLVFGGGFYLGRSQRSNLATRFLEKPLAYSQELVGFKGQAGSFPEEVDFDLYFEVWQSLKEDFVDKNQIKDKEMFYGSLQGLAASLGDSYTLFMDPALTKEFNDDLSGTFEGIGAEIGLRDELITIIAPLDGLPASQAGLLAGDKILAIDGQSALGLSVNEAVKRIRGPKGTTVTLSILRGQGDSTIDYEITRDIIFVKSVETEMRSDGIFVIRVSNFNNDTDSLFTAAVSEALLKNPRGIILDLRNNPGGYLETAINMAGEWIKEGIIVAEQFNDNYRQESFASGLARLENFPTVVLVNGGSASASEIVAGALRDYKKATIVGENTYGKGSVQTIRDLSDGSSLKITVARWLTPSGDAIDEKGIAPDIEVELTREDIEKDRDPQFDKALEVLKNKK